MSSLPTASPGKSSGMRIIILPCILLITLILAVYLQTGNHEFINLDDNSYITLNPHVSSGINSDNIVWAFSSVHSSNWHPLTWMSHMVDAQLYGMNPRGHHLTNVIIHAISSLILLFLLVRFTGSIWQSSFVATLFAIHPLHVESVAWVAERKDVLSAFFFLLTLLLFGEFTVKKKPLLYISSLLLFVSGLMSKPMLVTLPLVMLLMDFWPLGRYTQMAQEQGPGQLWGKVTSMIREKIPFFICSLLSSVITIYAQHKGSSIIELQEIPFWLRVENALTSYVKYISNTFWPHDLAVYYPFPSSIPLWKVLGSLAVLMLVTTAAIRTGRRHAFLVMGWLWFLVTLLPVIGLFQVGNQSMADRYSYIPIIGIFIAVAWGVPELAKGLQHKKRIMALLACAVIVVSSVLTWRQLGYWKDSISLFRHTLEITSDNSLIHYNLGLTLHLKGNLDGAIHEYRQALKTTPNDKDVRNALGIALNTKGLQDEALQEFKQALMIDPNDVNSLNNLGSFLENTGELDGAIQVFQKALLINPNNELVRNNLEDTLVKKRMGLKSQ